LRYKQLGGTGLMVSEICLGLLPMGPLQKNLELTKCTDIVVKCIENGINFIDTAQNYKTYGPIREALKKACKKNNIVLSTKSAAKTYGEMKEAIHQAMDQMEVDRISIFHLHGARESVNIFEDRAGALDCLLTYKKMGVIANVGVATHSVAVVRKISQMPEIDVVFPILNIEGLGVLEGTVSDMIGAIGLAAEAGKGVFLMKALGGGNLIERYHEAMSFARGIPGVASIAVGMISEEEVEYNVSYFNGEDTKTLPGIKVDKKRLIVLKKHCIGDGACVQACPNSAIIITNNKADIDTSKCLLCGYCTRVCPMFAIRVL